MKRNLQSDEDSYGEGEHKTEDEKFSGFSDVSPTSTKSITNENINNQTSNGSDDKVIILDVGGAINQVHAKPMRKTDHMKRDVILNVQDQCLMMEDY